MSMSKAALLQDTAQLLISTNGRANAHKEHFQQAADAAFSRGDVVVWADTQRTTVKPLSANSDVVVGLFDFAHPPMQDGTVNVSVFTGQGDTFSKSAVNIPDALVQGAVWDKLRARGFNFKESHK